MKTDYVIVVDKNDRQICLEEKLYAHKNNLLHRAFSIFLFNDSNQILLQKRAPEKYHSANLWSNTCCSHPKEKLTLLESAELRLVEEMGIKTKLEKTFSFIYSAKFNNGLFENEFDHVFFGKYNDDPVLNTKEAQDFMWIEIRELKKQIKLYPAKFTVWLKIIFENYYKYFKDYEDNNL